MNDAILGFIGGLFCGGLLGFVVAALVTMGARETEHELDDGVRKVLKEVAEGKHRPKGEWVVVKSPLSNETIVKCDKCGDEFIGNDVEDYNFCPNCGADMQKESEQ